MSLWPIWNGCIKCKYMHRIPNLAVNESFHLSELPLSIVFCFPPHFSTYSPFSSTRALLSNSGWYKNKQTRPFFDDLSSQYLSLSLETGTGAKKLKYISTMRSYCDLITPLIKKIIQTLNSRSIITIMIVFHRLSRWWCETIQVLHSLILYKMARRKFWTLARICKQPNGP